MQWEDKGILIGIKKFGETDIIATFITFEHGLSKGLIKGGISKKQKPYLQIGNFFNLLWKSRLEEQLGFFTCEASKIFGATFFNDELKLKILSSSTSLLYDCLAENQKYTSLYNSTKSLILLLEQNDNNKENLYAYLQWEKNLLSTIGFALSLDKCNATGTCENLYYISPKTGYAICESAGRPYKNKLLKMPRIWQYDIDIQDINIDDIKECLKILSYFFEKHIYAEKNKPFPYIRKGLEN